MPVAEQPLSSGASRSPCSKHDGGDYGTVVTVRHPLPFQKLCSFRSQQSTTESGNEQNLRRRPIHTSDSSTLKEQVPPQTKKSSNDGVGVLQVLEEAE
jgi:hypothetical protein